MTEIRIADFSHTSEAVIDDLYDRLSGSRATHIRDTARPAARAQRIVAGYILEEILRNWGITREPEYSYDKNGKPYLTGEDSPFISISHSGKYAAAIVSDSVAGIDIEAAASHKNADIKRIAARFFCEEEKKWIGENRQRFFEVWTYKEAYAKAKGVRVAEYLAKWDYTGIMDKTVSCEIEDRQFLETHCGRVFGTRLDFGGDMARKAGYYRFFNRDFTAFVAVGV
ncbi:MAG: 4'-phosphopantetheinyl transferase superfamily protein [Lachnospiraceae bacterium]|nr:4'-phosphopantetheinyl transferase superfamily protein [Lachnospiraceae bacterium]